MPKPLNIIEFWIAVTELLSLLKSTEEGAKRRQRRRRFRKLKQARKKRDSGKWSEARYAEEVAEINRLYPVD